MNYEKPATGIFLQKDFGDSKCYRIACDCGDTDHDITLDVEAEDSNIIVRHYVKVQTNWWAKPTRFYWVNNIIHRAKLTWNVWFKGYLEYEACTYMTKQQAFNYAYTLNEAVKDVEKFQKESSKKP